MRGSVALILMYIAALTIAGCAPATKPTPATTTAEATTSAAPLAVRPAVFYAKGGALYVSDSAGTAGRKLTDGPSDAQPAPSPDGAHVAFIRNAEGWGGELWVLDLSPEHNPIGAPRRLVDPAALPPLPPEGGVGGEFRSPRWSPTGKQVAFLESTVGGGFILVAAADTGAIVPLQRPLSMSELAADEYTWAPDGTHIAWRAAAPEGPDAYPVDVNVLTVGGASAPAAKGTNAFSVAYDHRGESILFANADATGDSSSRSAYQIPGGGIYSVATPGGVPGNPPATPTSLFTGQGLYTGVAALASGAVAFTETDWRTDGSSTSILQVFDPQSSVPPRKIADVAADAQGPAWTVGDVVAYIGASPEMPLLVTDLDNQATRRIDTGVESFAWQP